MPWTLSSVREIRQRPSMQAMTRGGYQVAETPDPNDAMETFQRSQELDRPNRELLRQSADEADRTELAKVQAEEERRRALPITAPGRISTINPVAARRMEQAQVATSPWREYFQSLKNRGVESLQTGAAAGPMQGGYDNPQQGMGGFFETQRPSMAGLQSAAQLGRQNDINAFMANYNAGAYQDMRRR